MSDAERPYEELLLTVRRQLSQSQQRSTFKGPFRVIRFCILGILLPCLICVLVLYMRYRVYTEQMYPLSVSDMRMLDNRISTSWCQRQLIKVNATFNAFLLKDAPQLEADTKPLTMVRHLMLEDDTKEYWGFYLLRGSTVTISTCVRWPGASLIVIRGHKHLHDCAYIGDDSSEELDEVLEAIRDGTYVQVNSTKGDRQPSNIPHLMKRHRQDVEFHDPDHKDSSKNNTLSELLDTSEITDAKQLRKLLEMLDAKRKEEKEKPNVHVHRSSTIGEGEKKNFKFRNATNDAIGNSTLTNSEEVMREVLTKLKDLGDKGGTVLEKINERFQNSEDINMGARHYSKPPVKYDENIDNAKRRKRELILGTVMGKSLNEHDEENDLGLEEGFVSDGIADDRGTINETTLNDMSNSEFWSSFSSSEEALLNCAGLILNLPLTPHRKCSNASTPEEMEEAYLANTITYKVPINGYYFFVYNSENEIQTNYIRVRFNLHKKVYNVSDPVSTCRNTSEFCAMNLNFWSDQKVVMELPVREHEDLWNNEFVVISQCEPRTAVYVAFVISIPILIMIFAFQ